nr:hypothetical protein [Actinomycetota bacterium]
MTKASEVASFQRFRSLRSSVEGRGLALITVGLVMTLLLASCSGGDENRGIDGAPSALASLPQPTQERLELAGLGDLPVAPASDRIDIATPTFTNPTQITNPLFPISDLRSAILSGRVDGKPFHTETTLLPETRFIEWTEGETVETLVSQYIAYLDGRMEEAALDFYAQADDGSVWYFGEEVNEYRNGSVFSTEGTWLAGRDGPPAMIMPGDPQIGDVHRPENIPAVAFEEVEITTVDKTVAGPTGPVQGALVGRELHDDGSYSDKIFAPGYGEFFSAHEGDVEAMALAVPADVSDEPEPNELDTLSSTAERLLAASQRQEWRATTRLAQGVRKDWESYKQQAPRWLLREGNRAIEAVIASVRARDQARAGNAAIDIAQTALDLKLRYRSPLEIDLGRAGLWGRQVVVDARNDDLEAVTGDGAVLDWIRGRLVGALDEVDATRIDAAMAALGGSIADEDLGAARKAGERLIDTVERIHPAG